MKNRTEHLFDLIAPLYALADGYLQRHYRLAVGVLSERCPLGEETSVLDVGTGTGALAGLMAELTPRVTGIDPSRGMLAAARRRHGKTITLLRLAAQDLHRFETGAFDVVTAALSLHELSGPDRRRALSEMRRIARRKVMIIDYLPHRSFWISLVERLEGSHYPDFLAHFGADLTQAFPKVEVVRLNAVWGVYLCDP